MVKHHHGEAGVKDGGFAVENCGMEAADSPPLPLCAYNCSVIAQRLLSHLFLTVVRGAETAVSRRIRYPVVRPSFSKYFTV